MKEDIADKLLRFAAVKGYLQTAADNNCIVAIVDASNPAGDHEELAALLGIKLPADSEITCLLYPRASFLDVLDAVASQETSLLDDNDRTFVTRIKEQLRVTDGVPVVVVTAWQVTVMGVSPIN